MVSINYSAREVCCKIVYYGPGLSGKTTNLQYVHSKVPANTRGKLISLATEADRTLYFDFLPINIGTINGFQAKIQLYTVPGQVYYNATRKLVLRGVDGVVFVADSQVDKMDENIESLANLEENLTEYGYDIDDLPFVIQYNKRDLPGVDTVEELQSKLNARSWPHFEASATVGNGVFDTLKLIIKLVLEKAKRSSGSKIASATTAQPRESQAGVATPVQGTAVGAREASGTAVCEAPVAVAAEPQAEASAEVKPAADAAPEVACRPFPGGETKPDEIEPSAQPSASPEVVGKRVETQPEDNTVDRPAEGVMGSRESLQTPQMAPSLRRRGDARKRGFFKRLFGIR